MLYSINNPIDSEILYSNLIDEFARESRSISYGDVCFSRELEIDPSKIVKILNKDQRFIKLGDIKKSNSLQYLQKVILLEKLLQLNFKVSNNKIKNLKIIDFLYFIDSILKYEIEENDIDILLDCGGKFGLVYKNKANLLSFPYSDIYKTLKENYFHDLTQRFLNLICELDQSPEKYRKIKNEFFKDFINSYILDDRNRKIFEYKFGFNDGKKKTLEVTGIKFKITRERVRQIISKNERNITECSKNTSEKLFKIFYIKFV